MDSALLAAYAGRYQFPHLVKDGARVVRLDILDSGETVPGTRIDEDVPKG